MAAFLSLVGIELAGQALYWVVVQERYSCAQLLNLLPEADPAIVRAMERGRLPRRSGPDILHPYVGLVRDVSKDRSESHGFANLERPIRRREEGKLLIALTGGSVAEQLGPYLEELLVTELGARNPSLQPVVLNFALGGYKQPQQLMILAYMFSLGAEFDVVINVDGFNELVLSIEENYENEVFPFFPRAWGARLGIEQSSKAFVLAGKIRYLRDREKRLAEAIQRSPLRLSVVYGALRRYQIVEPEAEIGRSSLELVRLGDITWDLERNGPSYRAVSEEDLLAEIARNWRRSSALMAALATQNGAAYHHFLQPNQYLRGAKRLSSAERSIPGFPQDRYSRIVENGYPLLKLEGKALEREGVAFHDATMVFAEHDQTLYSDACCHYNETGNSILARFVLDRIHLPSALRLRQHDLDTPTPLPSK